MYMFYSFVGHFKVMFELARHFVKRLIAVHSVIFTCVWMVRLEKHVFNELGSMTDLFCLINHNLFKT